MNVEMFSNLLQTLVAVVASVFAINLVLKKPKREYLLLAGFFVSFALGIVYWCVYNFLMDVTPQVFYVADLSWISGFLFLLSLEFYLSDDSVAKKKHWTMGLSLILTLVLGCYFCWRGKILIKFIWMLLLGICLFSANRNVVFSSSATKPFHIWMIVYIFTEYALWFAASFWISDTMTNPYFWFDFLLTFELALLLPIFKKAVE